MVDRSTLEERIDLTLAQSTSAWYVCALRAIQVETCASLIARSAIRSS
jgi:hypothetical protein